MRLFFAFIAALAISTSGCGARSTPCKGTNCGNSGTDGGGGGGDGLVINPQGSSITVNGGAATQQFSATLNGADVTADTLWAVADDKVGTVAPGGLFTSAWPLPHGGTVSISGTYNGKFGATSLTLNYVAPPVTDKGAPADAANDFAGAASGDPTETPRIIYPFDGVMLARNILQNNIQWAGSTKDQIFRIHVVGATIDATFFVGQQACSTVAGKLQCKYQPTNDAWQAIAVSAAGAPVSLNVSGTAGADQPVADSPPITLNLSPEDVKGGLYYFSPSIQGLKRLPFGASAATNFVQQGGGYNCTGCHTVSRDGKKVASTFWGGDGTGGMVDGTNGKNFLIKPEAYGGNAVKQWNFATFNPDGTLLLTNWAGVLTLRDGTTGAKKMDIPANLVGGKAVMPEWSADGKQIVFVQLPAEGKLGSQITGNLRAGDWIVGNSGNIATISYDNGTFGQAQVIVPSVAQSEYHYYPSWSPDNQWILFVSAKWPGSSPTADLNLGTSSKGYTMSYDQDTARLRLVQAMPGSPVIELANATHAMNKTASWPKFAPFIQKAGTLVFFTFSAKFNYGYIVTDGQTPQLWMSAIDLQKAGTELGGSDPSYPPFWLPFQDPKEKNHSGIWTQEVGCTGNPDCPSEFSCEDGQCVPNIPG